MTLLNPIPDTRSRRIDPNSPATAKILLGFDFGLKRIGVAVGQEITGSARPLITLKVKNRSIPWQQISQLIEKWSPDALVVGLPLNQDQSEHAITKAARRFGHQLNGRYNLPVYWVDERLTSYAAQQQLADRGVKSDNIDSVAAQLILESWMQTSEH